MTVPPGKKINIIKIAKEFQKGGELHGMRAIAMESFIDAIARYSQYASPGTLKRDDLLFVIELFEMRSSTDPGERKALQIFRLHIEKHYSEKGA